MLGWGSSEVRILYGVLKTQLALLGEVRSELRGLEYIHKQYGRLEWADLLRPATRIARNGVAVTQNLVDAMEGFAFLD